MGQPMTAASAQPLVGVRYVGTRPYKDDNLLGRRGRRWQRGEVLKVPVMDAASYLKHPMVWAAEAEPWDAGAVQEEVPVGAPSDALVRMIEAGDIDGLRLVRPDLADLWERREAEVHLEIDRETIARKPLAEDEAGRLLAYVPGLAKALVQGVSESVFAKVDFVMDLLMAYPPLLEATLEAERHGKARKDVLRRLTSMTHDMLREVERRVGGTWSGRAGPDAISIGMQKLAEDGVDEPGPDEPPEEEAEAPEPPVEEEIETEEDQAA